MLYVDKLVKRERWIWMSYRNRTDTSKRRRVYCEERQSDKADNRMLLVRAGRAGLPPVRLPRNLAANRSFLWTARANLGETHFE